MKHLKTMYWRYLAASLIYAGILFNVVDPFESPFGFVVLLLAPHAMAAAYHVDHYHHDMEQGGFEHYY